MTAAMPRRQPILRRADGPHRRGQPAAGEGARVTPPLTPVVIDGDRFGVALLQQLRARISGLPAGTIIHLIAADPAAPIDLPAWCHLTGHAHLGPIRAAPPAYVLLTTATAVATDSPLPGGRRA